LAVVIEVVALPLVRLPCRSMSAAVMSRALPAVETVFVAATVNVPAPLASVSALTVRIPPVVRLLLSVIPFLALSVRSPAPVIWPLLAVSVRLPVASTADSVRVASNRMSPSAVAVSDRKLESLFRKLMSAPVANAFSDTSPMFWLSVDVIPSTVIPVVVPLPRTSVAAVMCDSSVPSIVRSPAVRPRPIVSSLAVVIEVVALPLVRLPCRSMSAAVMSRALPAVETVFVAATVNVPAPLASVSALTVRIPPVVRLLLSVIPFLALSVRSPAPVIWPLLAVSVRLPVASTADSVRVASNRMSPSAVAVSDRKLESLFRKLMSAPVANAFSDTSPMFWLSVDVIPSTVIPVVVPLPRTSVAAVMCDSSVPSIVRSPAVRPRPIVSSLAVVIEVVALPLVRLPCRSMSAAVMSRALPAVETVFVAATVNVPAPLASVSALTVRIPPVVRLLLSVIPFLALSVRSPAPVIWPLLAVSVRLPVASTADSVRVASNRMSPSAVAVSDRKLESLFRKLMSAPVANAFSDTSPMFWLSVDVIPSTVIPVVVPLPRTSVAAVMCDSSVPSIVRSPAVRPRPIVSSLAVVIEVVALPLVRLPCRSMSAAVMSRALPAVETVFVAATVNVPAPLASVSALTVRIPPVVRLLLSVIPFLALSVRSPGAGDLAVAGGQRQAARGVHGRQRAGRVEQDVAVGGGRQRPEAGVVVQEADVGTGRQRVQRHQPDVLAVGRRDPVHRDPRRRPAPQDQRGRRDVRQLRAVDRQVARRQAQADRLVLGCRDRSRGAAAGQTALQVDVRGGDVEGVAGRGDGLRGGHRERPRAAGIRVGVDRQDPAGRQAAVERDPVLGVERQVPGAGDLAVAGGQRQAARGVHGRQRAGRVEQDVAVGGGRQRPEAGVVVQEADVGTGRQRVSATPARCSGCRST
jgi:hypothetical protein